MKTKATDQWLEYLTPEGMCGLCAQSGRIDTTPLGLKTPAGTPCGVVRYCICPNGRAMMEQDSEYKKQLPFASSFDPSNNPPDSLPTHERPDIPVAMRIAHDYAQTDGSHHKMWVIDQIMRAILGKRYAKWIKDYRKGDDGPDTYDWDTGIAP